jgi:hypothetical protein
MIYEIGQPVSRSSELWFLEDAANLIRGETFALVNEST